MTSIWIIGTALALFAGPVQASPTATKAVFGTAADGQQVDLVTLRNDHGMTVSFSSRGGTITELLVPDRKGKVDNVVLGVNAFAAWEKMGGFNAITGRYANRIGSGGFTLDGTFYKLPTPPNSNVTLHGGPNGFSTRLFKTEVFTGAGVAGARMTYVSADGENGFPGELTVAVTYSLTEDNVLRLEYEATTTKPTVVNLTNHAYFTLGGHASGAVYDQLLQVFASRWTPTDASLVPTGEIRSVEGTPFDFREPVRVGDRIYSGDPQMLLGRGLDHNFVLDNGGRSVPGVAVRLRDPKSGRQLEVRTTEPAVQIYSSNQFNGTSLNGDGRPMRQSDALAFETEHFPDSPNKPNFPSTVLRPGQKFHSLTEFAFSTDAKLFPK